MFDRILMHVGSIALKLFLLNVPEYSEFRLVFLSNLTADLNLIVQVMRLKDLAREAMTEGGAGDPRFRAQREQVNELLDSLKYYGVTMHKPQGLLQTAETSRRENTSTLN